MMVLNFLLIGRFWQMYIPILKNVNAMEQKQRISLNFAVTVGLNEKTKTLCYEITQKR